MLGVGVENETAEDLENDLSSWHTTLFQHPKPAAETLTVSNILTTQSSVILSEMLTRHLDWNDFFAVLIPIRFPKPARCEMQTKLFLGSAVTQRGASAHFVPVAYLPNSSRVRLDRWELQLPQILHPNLTHADYERYVGHSSSPTTYSSILDSPSYLDPFRRLTLHKIVYGCRHPSHSTVATAMGSTQAGFHRRTCVSVKKNQNVESDIDMVRQVKLPLRSFMDIEQG
jgi:hypothetical protein